MRRELEILAQIDDFLDGEITKKGLLNAVGDLKDLDTQIEIQETLRGAIQKEAFIEKSQKALSKFKLFKTVKTVLFTALLIGAIIAIIVSMITEKPEVKTEATPLPNSHENISKADSLIPDQIFQLNNSRDTIIITKAGMILSFPKNSFATENSEQYKIELKEAIAPAEIIKGGLSTMADATLLETGGMFKISAYQKDKILALQEDKFIDFLVPTYNKIPGMKLYTGEVTEDLELNWVRPKKLDNSLTPQDINSLNFYPEKYCNYLTKKGLWKNGKAWADSVYYDLSNITPEEKMIVGKDTTFNHRILAIESRLIKTFCNQSFNNTILATLEFEKRMPLIHKTKKNKILNLYTNNLNRNLYEIDSLAMKMAPSEYKKAFEYLMKLKEGKVENNKSPHDLALLNKAIKMSQDKRSRFKNNLNLTYYKGRLVDGNLNNWCNLDVPFAERQAVLLDEEERYDRLVENLKNEKNRSAEIIDTKYANARENIQIDIQNVKQFKFKNCFAYLLRKDAHSFEKIPLRQNKLIIEHKNIEDYELAIVGIEDGRQWLCIPDKIENRVIKLNLETEESFEAKIEGVGSSNRYKESMLKEVSKYSKSNNEILHKGISKRLDIAKRVYNVKVDTILWKKDVDTYMRNTFTIQTIDHKPARRKAPSIPSKLSREINQLKIFLNTTEYQINKKTRDYFKVEVYNEDGKNILDSLFSQGDRLTDFDTRQQNIAIFWGLKQNKRIKKGTYNAKLYYRNKKISSKSFKVF
jgi:hypothetical protein